MARTSQTGGADSGARNRAQQVCHMGVDSLQGSGFNEHIKMKATRPPPSQEVERKISKLVDEENKWEKRLREIVNEKRAILREAYKRKTQN